MDPIHSPMHSRPQRRIRSEMVEGTQRPQRDHRDMEQQRNPRAAGVAAAAAAASSPLRPSLALFLLLVLLACCARPLLFLRASGQAVAPFASVELAAPDPSFPRVDDQYSCTVRMASGGGWTFDYDFLLTLPSGSGETAVHAGAVGTTDQTDFKTITRTMATVKGQRLQCRVTATNGQGTAVQISTNTITLVNTPPALTRAAVQVRTPRIGSGSSYPTARALDVFECVGVGPSDIDDPPVIGAANFRGFVFNFTFLINGVAVPEASSLSVAFGTESLRTRAFAPNASLPLGLAKRGDTVSCTCTPGDSQDWGATRFSAGIDVGVTPPIAAGVVLAAAPVGETGGDGVLRRDLPALCSAASVSSPDGDPSSNFTIEYGFLWRGVSVSNQSSPTLPSVGWSRGDGVACFVRVDVTVDGVVYPGDRVYSPQVLVANTAPTTGSASLAPADAGEATTVVGPGVATVLSNLTCAPNVSSIVDVDGDAPFNSSFRWSRNGVPLSALPPSTSTLPARSGVKGDVFACEVATHDGFDLGPYSPAATLVLSNTPPLLSNATLWLDDPSAPLSISCVPGAVFDPDEGDTVARFEFLWVVDGVAPDPSANGSWSDLATLRVGSYALGPGHSVRCAARAIEAGSGADASSSSSSPAVSSPTLVLDAPRIVSFAAFSPSNREAVYTPGVTFNLTLSSATDFGVTGGSAYAWPQSATMPRAVVDSLLSFSEPLGADYEARWTSPASMLVTVNDVRTAGPPRIGTTTVALRVEGRVAFNLSTWIGGADSVSFLPSLYGGAASVSPPLSGDFGRAPPGFLWGVLSGAEGEDVGTPQQFNLSALGETLRGADAGLSHAFVLSSDRVYAVGSDECGQLGIVDTPSLLSAFPSYAQRRFVPRLTPVDSLAGLAVTSMSSGRAHSLALTQEGRLYVAGSSAMGQTGVGLYGDQSAHASQSQTSGFVELRLDADGTVYNESVSPAPAPALPNPLWSLVVAGYDFSLVVRTPPPAAGRSAAEQGSRVYAWGKHFGSRYTPTASSSSPSTLFPSPQPVSFPWSGLRLSGVSAGAAHVLFLTEGGQVLVWGSNREGQLGLGAAVASAPTPQLLPSLAGVTVVAISAGGWHSMLLTNTSATYCFGKNSDGQCGMHPELRFLPAPALLPHTAVNSTFASWLTAADGGSFYTNFYGQVWAFGHNEFGSLGVPAVYLPVPAYVSGLGSASIASVYSRRDISVALTPTKASPCLRGCNSHGSCYADACQCTPEWTGLECAVPVCRATGGAICSANGTCTVANDAPTCACFPGFTGPDCSLPDCDTPALQGCAGHGACVFDARLQPACSCAVGWKAPDCAACDVGWTGTNCDQLDCSAWNQCSGSQGVCSQVGRVGACVCASGWVGSDCNTAFCTGIPVCSGHGSCVSPVGNSSGAQPACSCDDRWSGPQCEHFTCAGAPHVCSGRGSCDVSSGTPLCSCRAGFTALDCSLPSCDGAPLHSCSGHGRCVVAGGSPQCACDGSYSGVDCSGEEGFLSAVLIALIVVGALVALVVLCACGVYAYKRRVHTHPRVGAQRSAAFFDPIAPRTSRARSNRIGAAPMYI